jgi:F-type H+-transporting ATPase subunit b
MRQTLLISGLLTGLFAMAPGDPVSAAEEKGDAAQPAKYKAELTKHNVQTGKPEHKEEIFDLKEEDHKKRLIDAILSGEVEALHVDHPPKPMDIVWDLGLWAVVVFVLLVLILRKAAWGPMLEGLQRREESIKSSVEEAKRARAETERITREFKVKMDEAYAEIPKIMEQARKDAEAFKEEMRAQTTKDIQTERQRLRREIETARDQALHELWNQAAQLATLISAKAIGRSLSEDDHRRLLDEAIAEIGQSANRR